MKKEESESSASIKMPVKKLVAKTNFYDLWLTKKLFDVCLIAQKSTFYSHRIVLIEHCSKLEQMLVNDPLKALIVVKLNTSSIQGLNLVLTYFYTHLIFVDLYNFADVFVTAWELGVLEVMEKCEGFIDAFCIRSNVVEFEDEIGAFVRAFRIFFPSRNEHAMYEKLRKIFISNFNVIVHAEEFLEMNEQVFHDLFTHESICPIALNKRFEASRMWLNEDKFNRYALYQLLLKSKNFQKFKLPAEVLLSNFEHNYGKIRQPKEWDNKNVNEMDAKYMQKAIKIDKHDMIKALRARLKTKR